MTPIQCLLVGRTNSIFSDPLIKNTGKYYETNLIETEILQQPTE